MKKNLLFLLIICCAGCFPTKIDRDRIKDLVQKANESLPTNDLSQIVNTLKSQLLPTKKDVNTIGLELEKLPKDLKTSCPMLFRNYEDIKQTLVSLNDSINGIDEKFRSAVTLLIH